MCTELNEPQCCGLCRWFQYSADIDKFICTNPDTQDSAAFEFDTWVEYGDWCKEFKWTEN